MAASRHPSPVKLEPFQSRSLRRAVDKGQLAETTLINYETRLNALQASSGLSVKHLTRHPRKAHTAIVDHHGDVPQTVRSYITAFLALFRHNPKMAEKHQKEYAEFKKIFQTIDKVVRERYDSNAPTERQREAYMPWADVIARRDALGRDKAARTSIDYLILCLYTMIPPLRADFGNVRILKREPLGNDALDGNYLVLRDRHMRLVLNEFKSKCKSIRQYNKVLPDSLDAVVRESLKAHPRKFLLVSPRTQEPFIRDNTYVVFVHRVFERILGKKVSISMLRHIYVNSLDFNTMTSGQKCQLAADMLHSTATNDRYRLIF
jgi:hypothetical protein